MNCTNLAIFNTENLGSIVLAATIIGIASFGIVDLLKLFPWFDLSGFENIFTSTVGGRWWLKKPKTNLDDLLPALQAAYGENVIKLLEIQYCAERDKGDLPVMLKRGVRIGIGKLSKQEAIYKIGAMVMSEHPHRPDDDQFENEQLSSSKNKSVDEFAHAVQINNQALIDMRINAALNLANNQFSVQTKLYATAISLTAAIGIGKLNSNLDFCLCLLIGITAVPLAPIGKDIATVLQEIAKKFTGK
jgi:hypothetical protein